MFNRMYLTKLVGAFLFTFGIFFLLLSITNIFNDADFINQYKECIEISDYESDVLNYCKENVSNGLGIVIRANQIGLTTGQYIKIYLKEIIEVLFAVLLIIIGDIIYLGESREHRDKKHKETTLKHKAHHRTRTKSRKKKK